MKKPTNRPSQDELTTAMHAELMEGEMSKEELFVWAVYGAMRRGIPKEEACRKYGFTVDEWDEKFEKLK